MASQPTPPKKVRLACRRCRVRRIKVCLELLALKNFNLLTELLQCDGQVPACTNCAKAGQVCLDVDSQNSSLTIPRKLVGPIGPLAVGPLADQRIAASSEPLAKELSGLKTLSDIASRTSTWPQGRELTPIRILRAS